MALASRRNLSSQYLFGMAILCFLSGVSLHQDSGGHTQNVTEFACPKVCSCASQGFVNCSYRNLANTPDENKLAVDASVYLLQHNSIGALSANSFNTTPNLTFLDVYQNKLTYIDDNAFAGLGRLQVLNISNQGFKQPKISITKISRNWFKGLTQLTVARMANIGAEVIDDEAFSDNPNIKQIQLDSNKLKHIPKHLFQHLPKLKIIQVCCNLLTEIDGEPFFGSNHVEEVQLYSNSINKLYGNAFKSMKNISVIELSENQLTSVNISYQTFRGLTCLTKLNLSLNNLKTIKKEWFQDLISLEEFDARGNRATTLDDNAFKNCLNLKVVDLRYNSIVQIPSTLFSGLPNHVKNIVLIYLSFNQLTSDNIPYQSFRGLTRLTKLHLTDNKLKTIKKEWFQDLESLEEFDASYNSVTILDDNTFKNCLNLKVVDLSENLIVQIPSTVFSGLPNHIQNITIIDLSSNQLTSDNIPYQTFRGLTLLNRLYLSDNKLKKIKKEWFQDLTSLEVFDASYNSVTTLDDNVFKNCLNLKKIYLSYNLIITIPSTVFSGLPNLLKVVCSYNEIENIGDGAFQGSNHIHWLEFQSNVLKTISKSTGLQDLPNLGHIFFYANPFKCNCDLVWFIRWIHSPDFKPLLDDVICNGPSNLALRPLLDLDPDSFSCSSPVVAIVVSIAGVLCMIASVLYYFRWDIRYLHQRRKLRKQYRQRNEEVDAPPNMQGNIFDAFISYSSKDCNWVLNVLHKTLENDPYNFRLCIDYRDFIPGNSIVDNIARAIRCSRKTIMILTKNFLKSQWCYFELEMARLRLLENSEDLFIIVLLEKITSKDMPLKLQQVLRKKSYIRWPDDEPARRLFWTKLETELRSPNILN